MTMPRPQALAELREQTGLVDDEYSIHEDVAVTGEAFVLAWPNEDGSIERLSTTTRACAMPEYEAPTRARCARRCKVVARAEDGVRLTLYYPDRMEYYATKRGVQAGRDAGCQGVRALRQMSRLRQTNTA